MMMMYNRRLLKSGQVSIPKTFQKKLGFKEGDYLFIYQHQKSIIIVNHHANQNLNQCIFRNGRISIPAEIRKLIGISIETALEITVPDSQDRIIIKVATQ